MLSISSFCEKISATKWRLYITSIAFSLVLAPEYSLVSLQTSIGIKKSLGSSNVFVYCMLCTVSLLLYVPLVAWIGRKKCLIIGEVPSVIYTLALLYQNIWTMTIASGLMGVAESIIMPASGAIVNAFYNGEFDGTIRKQSTSVFLTVLACGQAVTSIVPGIMLHDVGVRSNNSNSSMRAGSGDFEISDCGSNDCPMEYAFQQNSEKFQQLIPTRDSLVVFLCFFASLQTFGIIVHCFAIPSDSPGTRAPENESLWSSEKKKQDVKSLLRGSLSKLLLHMRSKLRMLTIPVQIQYGAFSAFLWSEFTRAYISCSLGVDHIGVCLFITYVVSFIVNFAFSRLTSSVSMPMLYFMGLGFEITTYIVAYVWEPDVTSLYVPYLLAGIMGVTHAARRIVSYVTASVYFDDMDSSYIVQTGCAAFGNMIIYAMASATCVYVKIYFLAPLSLLSTTFATIAHFRYWQ